MIDHISLAVTEIDRSRAFYDRALAALGARRVMDVDDAPGFAGSAYGTDHPTFWISGSRPPRPIATPPHGQHTAFAAADRAAVDAFYREALAAGGRDDGPPGLRPGVPSRLLRGFRNRPRRPPRRGGLPPAGLAMARNWSGGTRLGGTGPPLAFRWCTRQRHWFLSAPSSVDPRL